MDRRRIDWKSSARHVHLYAKEFETERNNQIVFAFDCGQTMCEPIGGMPRIDRAVSAALVTSYVALKGGTEKVVAFLKAQGVKEVEIQTESASITEEFELIKEDKVLPNTNVPLRSERRESKGFTAKQVVAVNSTNVAQIEKVSREITTLLEQGVDVTSHAPSYYYTRLGELKLEMLAEAADVPAKSQTPS